MTTWEYKLVPMKGGLRAFSTLEQELADLGLEGWELAAIDYGCWILKRPRTSEISKGRAR